MSRPAILVQARLESQRFPRKVLARLLGQPMLLHQLDRLRQTGLTVVVVTPASMETVSELHPLLTRHGYAVEAPAVRPDDVLARYECVARQHRVDPVIRVTGDCPLIDPDVIGDAVDLYESSAADYVALAREWPDGLDVEVCSYPSLRKAAVASRTRSEREHVTSFIWKNVPKLFTQVLLPCPFDLSGEKWSVDTAEDFAFVEEIYRNVVWCKPRFTWRDIYAYVSNRYPNKEHQVGRSLRNEGYRRSLAEEGQDASTSWEELRYGTS